MALPVPDEAAFLDMLLRWVVTVAENTLQRDAVVHAIASILNKRTEGRLIEHRSRHFLDRLLRLGLSVFLGDQLSVFWVTQIASTAQPPEKRRQAISTWTWLTKALLVRGDARAADHVDRLLQLFDDEEVSWDAARAIGGVVAIDRILTKKNHATIKFLYAQKYCTTVLPRIVEGAKSSDGMCWRSTLLQELRLELTLTRRNDVASKRQNAYLVALTSIIKSVPRTVYAHQMPTVRYNYLMQYHALTRLVADAASAPRTGPP